jgi:hypothetical protein
VRYTIKHTIETDAETYLGKLLFDAEFNRSLFLDYLGFTTWRIVEDNIDPDGTRHRKVESTPKVELPAAARKIFGDSVGYTEVGRWDPKDKKYYVQVFPNVAGDKIKTTSEVWVEPTGDKRCERVVSVDNSVKVFGIGGLIEGIVEQQTRDLYAKAAEYTNRWIREKGL